MRFVFNCFFTFFIAVYVNSQTLNVYGSTNFSFEQLNDSLQKNSSDTLKHKMFLNLYIKKAKATNNNEQLFESYYKFVAYETEPEQVHQYCDSLLLVAKNLPLNFKAIALQAKATAYYYEKDYINALKYELKALENIDQKKEAYTYYKSIYSIGLVYLHIQEYSKAYEYFSKARMYFESNKKYSFTQGYFKSIYREAFSLFYLNRSRESNALLTNAFSKKHLLKAKDLPYNVPYLNYVKALNLFNNKMYNESNLLLLETIPAIASNNDFANEANAYYYMGLNYVNLNNNEQAMVCFKKVDRIFNTKHYSNMEIKAAYTHLIKYYKEQNKPADELFYTNKLIKVMNHLQQEYKLLSSSLHYNFDISGLLADKQRLENDIKQKQIITNYMSILGAGLIIGLLLAVVYNYRKKKEFHKNYLDLLQQRKIKNALVTTEEQQINTEITAPLLADIATDSIITNTSPNTTRNTTTKELNDKAFNKLIPLLDEFEKNNAFLNNDITLNNLAQQWNTNRTYLSECINTYKGKSFIDYINSLRITYFLDEAEKDKKWYKLKIQSIAEALGFTSARSFSNAFLKETGIPPSFYIKKTFNVSNH